MVVVTIVSALSVIVHYLVFVFRVILIFSFYSQKNSFHTLKRIIIIIIKEKKPLLCERMLTLNKTVTLAKFR